MWETRPWANTAGAGFDARLSQGTLQDPVVVENSGPLEGVSTAFQPREWPKSASREEAREDEKSAQKQLRTPS